MFTFTMNLLGKEKIFTDQTKVNKSNTQFSKGHPKLRLFLNLLRTLVSPLLLCWITVQ